MKHALVPLALSLTSPFSAKSKSPKDYSKRIGCFADFHYVMFIHFGIFLPWVANGMTRCPDGLTIGFERAAKSAREFRSFSQAIQSR